jgi:uncharacterized protein with HEPN domain
VPPSLGDRLSHILEAIDGIKELLAGQTIATLAGDRLRRLALERLFEIICEASRHVPKDIAAREPNIDWRGMVDLGNVLRHAYHLVDPARLLRTAVTDLPPLKAFVERVLAEEAKR